MAPRETENNAYAKFWGDKQRTLWYVMVFLEWSIIKRSSFVPSRHRQVFDVGTKPSPLTRIAKIGLEPRLQTEY